MKPFNSAIKCVLFLCIITSLTGTSSASIISFQGLGHLSGDDYSEAFDLSADGTVVVGSSGLEPYTEAFRWIGGTMTGLGYLPPNIASKGWDASADGSVVVGGSASPAGMMACRWQGGSVHGLGTLGGASSCATF